MLNLTLYFVIFQTAVFTLSVTALFLFAFLTHDIADGGILSRVSVRFRHNLHLRIFLSLGLAQIVDFCR